MNRWGGRPAGLDAANRTPSVAVCAEFATAGWGEACPREADAGYRRARVRTGRNGISDAQALRLKLTKCEPVSRQKLEA